MSTETISKPGEEPCVVCGNEIHTGFTLCSHCGSHQISWKRNLRAFLAVFSGFSIVLTAVTLLISFYPQAKRTLFYQEDLELVGVNTTALGAKSVLSFVNKGDGDIFLSELIFRLEGYNLPFEKRLPIHGIIRQGELLGLPADDERASSLSYSDTVGPQELQAWLNSRSDLQIANQINRCFLMKPFDRTNGAFIISRSLASLPVEATIRFYSPDQREVRELVSETEIHTLLFRSSAPSCAT